jgi:hypothetical protein
VSRSPLEDFDFALRFPPSPTRGGDPESRASSPRRGIDRAEVAEDRRRRDRRFE